MQGYTFKKKILLGIIIGFALIIPGVSASSLCISFDLYNEIIFKLSKIKEEFKESIKYLLPFVIGLTIGIVFGVIFVKTLLNILPYSFIFLFSGIMLGSFKYKVLHNYKRYYMIHLIIGILIPVIICILSYKSNNKENLSLTFKSIPIYILLGLLISILELIPGASSSAILISLGYFNPLINSLSIKYILNNRYIIFIYLLLICGLLIGIIFISKVINKLLSKYNLSYLILGLNIGAIIVLFINKSSLTLYKSFNISNNLYDLILGFILFILSLIISFKSSNT